MGAALMGQKQRRCAGALHRGEHRRHPLGTQPGQPGGADRYGRAAAQAAGRRRHGFDEGRRRPEGICCRRPLRHRRLPQCAAAARRDARHLGRQAAVARQISRPVVLRARAQESLARRRGYAEQTRYPAGR